MTDEKENKFWAWFKTFMAALGAWAYKYVGGLFMEVKDGQRVVSIGRVSFMLVLLVLVWIWYRAMIYEEAAVLPPGIMEVFYVLAGYVFGSKVVGALKGKWNGPPK